MDLDARSHARILRNDAYARRWLEDLHEPNRTAADRFVALKASDTASSTRINHARALAALDAATGGKPWTALDATDIQAFMAGLRHNGYADDTMRLWGNCLKHFLRVVRNTTELPYDMMLAFRVRKNKGLPEWPVLTDNEETALFAAANRLRDQALIALLLEGLRIGEAVRLRWGSIQVRESGSVWIRLPHVEEGNKTGTRAFPAAKYGKVLEAWRLAHPNKGDAAAPFLLALTKRGRPAPGRWWGESGAGQVVDRIRLRAGLRKFRRHDLRHTCITKQFEAAGDQDVAREELSLRFWGSKDSRHASRYIHHTDEYREKMARRLAGIDGNAQPLAHHEKECPYCAEVIKAKAVKCVHCGEFLDASRPGPTGGFPRRG